MDQDTIGAEISEDRIEAGKQSFAQLIERLIRRHDRKIAVGHDGEQAEHLFQHGVMLTGDDDAGIDLRRSGKSLHYWRHLYCFRSGAKYG